MNKILQGDTLEILKTLPDELVDCIVTSPPYYGLRDYGVEGQIGLEKTLDEYLNKMLLITSELKRVLKKTGTMWWNHGDSYASRGKLGGDIDLDTGMDIHRGRSRIDGYPEKSLLLQAHRLAIRMVDEQGWILRNQIIWHKPNVMPSSVKDRFTVDFEPIFFFTKSKKYWFEPQYEAQTTEPHARGKVNDAVKYGEDLGNRARTLDPDGVRLWGNPLGRNKRTVWKIATKPYKEAHFATFPETLIETPIKAGCPEFICKKCGVAREKIYERETFERDEPYAGSKSNSEDKNFSARRISMMVKKGRELGLPHDNPIPPLKDLGYTDCGCNAGWSAGIVLDPFMGSGTTAYVARKLGRNYLGIELNPEYIKLCEDRLRQTVLLPIDGGLMELTTSGI